VQGGGLVEFEAQAGLGRRRGSTFSDTSTIRPRVPRLPAIARDTS
jgi:hypothetical protein